MPDAITHEDIDELVAFLPAFRDPDTAFAERWVTESGTFPYPSYTEDVRRFFALAGQSQWSDYDYQPIDAGEMLRDDGLIAAATLGQIKTMLTFCVRGERFADGHWEHLLKAGRVQALLERLVQIRAELG